ncbi:hypothetical protein A2154_02635 [Candidatus Gottesmanbacteria bacterium RBG_16_43_7]|uniref:Xanthine permease n=1 Tax=Candidatus Gottesmanbacteria bacterium RBG_16_43_7 TaxID=1798373 RepID=A0A1F5ZDW4_9BACT|nr:MAG: hypothetical protein A2154_02635 [Candidatus Gottesmanbacteria bacterium RBG_16_43_7]
MEDFKMSISWQDIWVAILTNLDVMSGLVLAGYLGYKIFPSALGFLIGAIGMLLTGTYTPVSFQQEAMVLAQRLATELRPRVTMILGGAVLTGIIGLLGLPQRVVDGIGQEIFVAMLAGVGLLLSWVALKLAKIDWRIGVPSLVSALIVQYLTNDLIWTITVSVPLGILIQWWLVRTGRSQYEAKSVENRTWRQEVQDEFRAIRPVFSRKVVFGILSVTSLTLGANWAYPAVNSMLTQGGLEPHYNQVTVISAISDFGSSLFGGPSMEVIVSATAAAPNPVTSGVIMSLIAFVVIISGLGIKLARYIPTAAMSGYLAAIGWWLVFIPSAQQAIVTGHWFVTLVTGLVTLFFYPFWGLIAGVGVKFLLGVMGVL